MRVMVLIKADERSETGQLPSEELVSEMLKFNEELVKAGVMLAGDGLHPSSRAKRVKFSGNKATVVDGPFAETKELIAGYWLWQVKSMDEAVEWVKRIPNPEGESAPDSVIEIREVFESEEFAEQFSPELREKEAQLRAQTSRG